MHKKTVSPDNPAVLLRSPQIINGCQSSMTLKKALEDGTLRPDTSLLIRVVETQDPLLVDQITTATNSQNTVKIRDLRSNDSLQRTLKMSFLNLGWFYETKEGEYKL